MRNNLRAREIYLRLRELLVNLFSSSRAGSSDRRTRIFGGIWVSFRESNKRNFFAQKIIWKFSLIYSSARPIVFSYIFSRLSTCPPLLGEKYNKLSRIKFNRCVGEILFWCDRISVAAFRPWKTFVYVISFSCCVNAARERKKREKHSLSNRGWKNRRWPNSWKAFGLIDVKKIIQKLYTYFALYNAKA